MGDGWCPALTFKDLPTGRDVFENDELRKLVAKYNSPKANICYRPNHKGWGVAWFPSEEIRDRAFRELREELRTSSDPLMRRVKIFLSADHDLKYLLQEKGLKKTPQFGPRSMYDPSLVPKLMTPHRFEADDYEEFHPRVGELQPAKVQPGASSNPIVVHSGMFPVH
jgi:hypothetical protein